jgi:hypothetical protein
MQTTENAPRASGISIPEQQQGSRQFFFDFSRDFAKAAFRDFSPA